MPVDAVPGGPNLWARLREAGDRYRGLLGQRDPTLLLSGGAISVIGDWLNTVALVELSYRLGEGSFGVGGLLAMRMLPPLLLQGAAGALVDRLPGRRLLVATQLLMAVIAGSFILLAAVPQLWLLYALVFALETLQTIARPATMVRFMEVVQPEQRSAANALYGMTSTTAQLGGASIGALMFALIGATPLFLLNSVTFLVVALAVSRTSPGRTRRTIEVTAGSSAATDGVEDGDGSTKKRDLPGYRRLLRRPDVVGYAGMTITIQFSFKVSSLSFRSAHGISGLVKEVPGSVSRSSRSAFSSATPSLGVERMAVAPRCTSWLAQRQPARLGSRSLA